jgi:lysozyme
MTRQINAAGLAIIKGDEGCFLNTYLCPARIPTNGWGHTGPDVHMGGRISQLTADANLGADLAGTEAGVAHLAPVCTDNQFSALVSFAYNEGLGKLRTSTLLRLHNAKCPAQAALEFPKWKYADGVVLNGLIKRRAQEAALYSKP